jgi:hypothetical protein
MMPWESFPSNPCAAGHTWIWTSGDTTGHLTVGIPCQCGAVVSAYEICPTCGDERLVSRPAEGKDVTK